MGERFKYTDYDQVLVETNDWEMAPQVNRGRLEQGEQTLITSATDLEPNKSLIIEVSNPRLVK